ncbi:MAG: type II CAAX prenyl endopeptidase Rce1 family protein [Sphingobacteriales bacterium]
MHKLSSITHWRKLGQLGVFFFLAFLIAWGTWFPSFNHPDSLKLLSFVGLFAPAISAIVVSYLMDKKSGVKKLLRRYKIVNFKIGWYVFAIFFIPLLFIMALYIDYVFFHTKINHLLLPQQPLFVFISFIWLIFINSGEEIGWRGFALPNLQAWVKNPVYASLILGIFWSTWHLPIYLVPGQSSIPLSLFLFFTVGLSFLYTILFNQTGGSLLSVLLLHASTDVVPRIFNIALFSSHTWFIFGLLAWLSAIILFVAYRKKNYVIVTDKML